MDGTSRALRRKARGPYGRLVNCDQYSLAKDLILGGRERRSARCKPEASLRPAGDLPTRSDVESGEERDHDPIRTT